MCVTFSILSHLSLSLSTFTLRRKGKYGLSPLYLSLSLIYITFLVGAWPILGLLDSSLGYPQKYSIAGDYKGFLFFWSLIHSFIHHLKGCRWILV